MKNGRTTTLGALRYNVAQKEAFIDKLLAENMELLEACKAVDIFFAFFDNIVPPGLGNGARESLRMIRDAIKKAEGGNHDRANHKRVDRAGKGVEEGERRVEAKPFRYSRGLVCLRHAGRPGYCCYPLRRGEGVNYDGI